MCIQFFHQTTAAAAVTTTSTTYFVSYMQCTRIDAFMFKSFNFVTFLPSCCCLCLCLCMCMCMCLCPSSVPPVHFLLWNIIFVQFTVMDMHSNVSIVFILMFNIPALVTCMHNCPLHIAKAIERPSLSLVHLLAIVFVFVSVFVSVSVQKHIIVSI